MRNLIALVICELLCNFINYSKKFRFNDFLYISNLDFLSYFFFYLYATTPFILICCITLSHTELIFRDGNEIWYLIIFFTICLPICLFHSIFVLYLYSYISDIWYLICCIALTHPELISRDGNEVWYLIIFSLSGSVFVYSIQYPSPIYIRTYSILISNEYSKPLKYSFTKKKKPQKHFKTMFQ